MKQLFITGGIGNQMFQYAMLLALQHKGVTVRMNTSLYDFNPMHHGYMLDKAFGIHRPGSHGPLVWNRIVRNGRIPALLYKEDVSRYCNDAFTTHKPYIDGCWINEHYFADIKDTLRKVFTFHDIDERNLSLSTEMQHCNSVSIHIRRGDYLSLPQYHVCDEDYYRKAITYIKERIDKPRFYFFSDDPSWCKEFMSKMTVEYVVVDHNTGKDSYKDMYLMTQCRHNIIANSTFSWWGVWLGQQAGRIVVCPDRWIEGWNFNPCLKEWHHVNCPRLSVVLSTYNDEKYIATSVQSILGQTYPHFEFIIVNDGSTDGTLDIIKSFKDERIVIIDKPNTGLIDSLNTGVRAAKCDWIARMDGDDVAEPDRFREQVKMIDKNTCVISSQCRLIDETGLVIGQTKFLTGKFGIAISRKLELPLIVHPSTLFRKDVFLKVGGYDKNMYVAEDCDLFCKMLSCGKLKISKLPLLNLRKHGSNISSLKQREQAMNQFISYIKYLYGKNYVLPDAVYNELKNYIVTTMRYNTRFAHLGSIGVLLNRLCWYFLIKTDKEIQKILK